MLDTDLEVAEAVNECLMKKRKLINQMKIILLKNVKKS
jgi:hypothetical protein